MLEPCNAKVLRTVLRGLGASNRAWLLGGCVASRGQHHLAGNGADFLLVLSSRTLEEPMHEAKQMTTGQPVGAASHMVGGFPPPRESAASQYRVGLFRFAPGRVLVSHGGVFECSSRMNGKPSSPVLRGLGASNGARLLDPWDYFRVARHEGAMQISDVFQFLIRNLLNFGSSATSNSQRNV